jgi:hypothetical protein
MSLSATAEATIPQGSLRLLARLPSCVSFCQHAAERQLRSEPSSALAFG